MARILLVDDAVDLRNALVYALQSEGHVVAAADDGEQGMALQRGFNADVLITDIFMPNKDGIETIQEFKEMSPGARIVVMSASNRLNSSTYLTIARELGVDEVMNKPFSIQELLDVVARLTVPRQPSPTDDGVKTED
jgi:DNA-binding response OmpR family regulator